MDSGDEASNATDPLDQVLVQFKIDQAAASALNTRLNHLSQNLVNAWRNGCIPLLHEYNQKLSPVGLLLNGLVSSFGPNGSPTGSKLSVVCCRHSNLGFPQEIAKLTIVLERDGSAKISITGPKGRQWDEKFDDEWFSSDVIPQKKFRGLFAELAGSGLAALLQ